MSIAPNFELGSAPPPATSPPPCVLIVGAGPVGHALAAGFARAGLTLRHWSRSRGPLWLEPAARAPADIVVLAVRDDAIAQAAQFVVEHGAAGPSSVLLHCAGALSPLDVFAPHVGRIGGRGLLHPLRSFATVTAPTGEAVDADGVHELRGTVMAVAGDPAGQAAARTLAEAVGGIVLPLSAEQLAAYHAAAVLAAGHVAALLEVAAHVLQRIGLPRAQGEPALTALTRSVLDNVARFGLPAALTGPIARGDAATVARHFDALRHISGEATEVYRVLSHTALDLAYRKGAAAHDQLAEIERILAAVPAPPAPPPLPPKP